MASRSNEFNIFSVPEEDEYREGIQNLVTMGMLQIIGNSANLGRKRFGEEAARIGGVNYVHLSMPTSVDELTKEQFAEMMPPESDSFKSALAYLQLSAMSKFYRYQHLSVDDMKKKGVVEAKPLKNTVILLGDSESMVDGVLEGKPPDESDAVRQIERLVTGDPYTLVASQVVMWGTGVDGLAANIHMTPMRVNPKLGKTKREKLRETWLELYRDPNVPVTPGAVSASNERLRPYMQVGLSDRPQDQIALIEDAILPDYRDIKWRAFLDLTAKSKDEVGTNLMGAAPRGFADVLVRLASSTQEVKDKFREKEEGEYLVFGQLARVMLAQV